MNVRILQLGMFETNCYLLSSDNNKTIIIDPAFEAERIIEEIEANNLKPESIILTHGHMDHIMAVSKIKDRYNTTLGIHSKDEEWAFTDINRLLPAMPIPQRPCNIENIYTKDEDFIEADMRYTVIHTPGHTPGSVCFYFMDSGILFTGDTLFAGNVGRTDLYGGSSKNLKESLKKLKLLPDDTIIYPGHGPSSTIGEEKQKNFFMR